MNSFYSIALISDKPIGAAPRGQFVWGGSGRFGKKNVTLRGLRISQKKEILRKLIYCKCILIDSKLCTIQYYNIYFRSGWADKSELLSS